MFQTLKVSLNSTRTVEAIPVSRVLDDRDTINEMDVEGAQLQLRATPRHWRNFLLADASAMVWARWLSLRFSILDALRDGGRTHLHLDVKVGTVKCWLREQFARKLDFVLCLFRSRTDETGGILSPSATQAMRDLMDTLPAMLRTLEGYPETPQGGVLKGAGAPVSCFSLLAFGFSRFGLWVPGAL